MNDIKRSFPPVVDVRIRLLVLGSLPGEVSLAQARYYAHPRNQFWRLMEAVIGAELQSLSYPARLERLLRARVGLWDVIGSATRLGSLDGAIRDPRANALAELADQLPALRAVGFNGGKAAVLGTARLGRRADLALLPLPSSSPAYTRPFEEKRARWMKLAPYLST